MHHFDLTEICNGKTPISDGGKGYYKSSGRNNYEIAYSDTEKIITCSAFRRLQGKTQVYPFPETDAVRNRLTHSIEVAHVGQTIASRIVDKLDVDAALKNTIIRLSGNGCLLHDIGNPPFGHSGEESIRDFFLTHKDSIKIIGDLACHAGYIDDFLNFDGNAQGFRLATTLNGRKYSGGLRLGAASLCTMVKYPYSSSDPKGRKGKFGFMQSEAAYFKNVFAECGLIGQSGDVYRSPISVIVEAADDIAYLTADLQDAYIYGDLEYAFVKRELDGLAGDTISQEEFDDIKDERDKVAFLRSAAVNKMIALAAKNIFDTYFSVTKPVPGYEKQNVWASIDSSNMEKSERRIRYKSEQRIYRGRKKMSLQVAGGRIINFVLMMQIKALDELYRSFLAKPRSLDAVDEDVRANIQGIVSEEKYAAYLMEKIERLTSRQGSQVILRMPTESLDQIRHLLIRSLKTPDAVSSDKDPELAYGLVQLSLDFVSGTTDRYLSTYSREWAGPSLG